MTDIFETFPHREEINANIKSIYNFKMLRTILTDKYRESFGAMEKATGVGGV